jgi:hypothetical protein
MRRKKRLYSTVAVRVTRNDKVECSIHSKGMCLLFLPFFLVPWWLLCVSPDSRVHGRPVATIALE